MNSGLVLHTILGLLLLLIPAGALYFFERKKLPAFAVAIVRMLVQLLGICLMVWALIKVDKAWLSMLWLAVMTVVSTWLVLRRCSHHVKRLFPAVAVGLFSGIFLVGMWLLVLVLPVRPFDARWFVPVMALLLGHTSAMLTRGLSTYVSALKSDEQQYEFLRGNGQSHLKTLKPFVRRSLLAVLSPTMANLAALGLAAMPLLLCGLFLGGMTPINAFVVMLHMIVGCVASSVLSLLFVLYLVDRVLFDNFGKLLDETVKNA